MDIIELRQQIDQVDRELIRLFTRRMDISEQIAEYKKDHHLPVFDPIREQEKLYQVSNQVPQTLESSIKVLYSLLFELSRSHQSTQNAAQTPLFQQICTAIETTPNLFPQQAIVACREQNEPWMPRFLQRLFKSASTLSFTSTQAVFDAVDQGLCRYALINAKDPAVIETMRNQHFFIVRAIASQNGLHYLLIGKQLEIYPGADRTSLLLSLPNQPGSLYRILARLYTLGLNIAKLESADRGDDRMLFYFDLETSIYSPEFAHLMCELEDLCDDFRYLGSYTEVIS